MPGYDAVVVGGGPNGLSAALTLAAAGHPVLVVEGKDTLGGGTRSEELTLPGVVHDVCSTVHPLALASPYFRSLPLDRLGLTWAHPPLPLAHPLDDGSAVVLHRSVEETAAELGSDGGAYRRLVRPFVDRAGDLVDDVLAPRTIPRHPLLLSRFGRHAARSASGLSSGFGPRARALLAGLAAHSMLPLDAPLSGGIGLLLGVLGHASGWPFASGGSRRISEALATGIRAAGGEVETGAPVASLRDLPETRATILTMDPHVVLEVGRDALPEDLLSSLASHRRGPGAFKVDWALDGPIPWTAETCAGAGTVHVGGTFEEIRSAEAEVAAGGHPEHPFVLVAQATVADPSRAPEGVHTAWAYCHVPNGSTEDMTGHIEDQVERFAPGFRGRVRERHVMSPADLEAHNPSYVGGDIAGGHRSLLGVVAGRFGTPYSTGVPGLFLASASTPPGPGVHGMSGHLAAAEVLRLLRDAI